MTALAALRAWRNYWPTAHSDPLTLTGAQADELCRMLVDGTPPDSAREALTQLAEYASEREDTENLWLGCYDILAWRNEHYPDDVAPTAARSQKGEEEP
jgi:hypothetical protein